MDDPGQSICATCGGILQLCEAFSFAGRQVCGSCASLERRKEEERLDTRECPKCRKETRSWGRKAWRDGLEYCKECEKSLERVWFIANSCMLCNRLIPNWEERIRPPESFQQRDPYVKHFVVRERAVCWECYVRETKRPCGMRNGGGQEERGTGRGRSPLAVSGVKACRKPTQ